MTLVTSLILRQMRAPLIILIMGYGITTLGMVLTPGIDDQGNIWHMSFFEAFYFVSFTATTIGFGEIPYPLSSAQRIWALITIYITVISWFFALGKILTLIQDPTYREAAKKSSYAQNLKNIHENFFLICGFGETGHALVQALSERHIRCVIIEQDSNKVKTLPLIDYSVFVPGMQGDARDPNQLILAGLKHRHCTAVIAVTASDDTNLKIAITSKLLNPKVSVICRSEIKDFEENMFSFGTDFVINPFEAFANVFAMAMQSPSLYLLYDWLTGVPDTQLTNPLYINQGHWVICGFGRFGQSLFTHISKQKIPVTIIDPSEATREEFLSRSENKNNDFIIGTGFDAHTLTLAGIEHAVGLVSGTDDDSNNLSIIMTAREINKNIFVVARQNKKTNQQLFEASKADIIMQPSDIIARKIRTLLTNPLLVTFLAKAREQDAEWSNIAISRLSGVLGEHRPSTWTIDVTETHTKALYLVLKLGRVIRVGNLLQDPRQRERKLTSVALLLKRGNQIILMPTDDIAIKSGDQILYCGTSDAERSMKWTLNELHSLNYIMTYEDMPDSLFWKLLHIRKKRNERRNRPRPKQKRLLNKQP
ncbi:MAG: NAD-binding protein [Gammaproteobacteria bacterium]|nr:NAD-binding protein [Gammaproteobacteria bacterium]